MAADPAKLREILAACREHGVSVAEFSPDGAPTRLVFGDPKPPAHPLETAAEGTRGPGVGQPPFPTDEQPPGPFDLLLQGQHPGLIAELKRRFSGDRYEDDLATRGAS